MMKKKVKKQRIVKEQAAKIPQGKTPLQLLTLSYKRARAIRYLQKINKVIPKR